MSRCDHSALYLGKIGAGLTKAFENAGLSERRRNWIAGRYVLKGRQSTAAETQRDRV